MIFTTLLALALPALAAPGFSTGANHVRLRDTNFCVDVPAHADKAAGPVALQLWDCVADNTNQAWLHTTSSRTPGNPVVISSGTTKGQCIGVTADSETRSATSPRLSTLTHRHARRSRGHAPAVLGEAHRVGQLAVLALPVGEQG